MVASKIIAKNWIYQICSQLNRKRSNSWMEFFAKKQIPSVSNRLPIKINGVFNAYPHTSIAAASAKIAEGAERNAFKLVISGENKVPNR